MSIVVLIVFVVFVVVVVVVVVGVVLDVLLLLLLLAAGADVRAGAGASAAVFRCCWCVYGSSLIFVACITLRVRLLLHLLLFSSHSKAKGQGHHLGYVSCILLRKWCACFFPASRRDDRPFHNHTQRYLRSAEKMARFHTKCREMGLTDPQVLACGRTHCCTVVAVFFCRFASIVNRVNRLIRI